MNSNFKLKISNFFLELFFPSFCFGCEREGAYLCPDCKETLEISEYSYCLCNKNPLRLPPENKTGKCVRCEDKKLSGLYSSLAYKEKFLTRKLIHKFKYAGVKTLAKNLAEIMAEHLIISGKNTDDIWENGVLVPVPMECRKLKERGYNQAEKMAKELAKIVKIPVVSDVLLKISKTKAQMKLSARKREENLKGAFAVKKPAGIAGKKIFLVDDVYTTGSTMEECAKTLREAGAKSVWGVVIAREG